MTYGVLTVCLNSAQTIARTIDSVLAQTVPPDQYVIVDGGSTDATLEIIRERELRARTAGVKTRFLLLNQATKGGITEAWNIGLASFKPDIVFILNSDDYYENDAAASVLSEFERAPDVGIVLAPGRYFDAQSGKSFVCRNRPFLVLPFAMPVIHPGCFVRKSVYEEVGLFDVRYRVSADYDFVYRCHRSGIQFVRLDRVLVNVQLGGYSAKNMGLGTVETQEIALRHSRWPLFVRAAYQIRRFMGN